MRQIAAPSSVPVAQVYVSPPTIITRIQPGINATLTLIRMHPTESEDEDWG
jgi:hypothetical protein